MLRTGVDFGSFCFYVIAVFVLTEQFSARLNRDRLMRMGNYQLFILPFTFPHYNCLSKASPIPLHPVAIMPADIISPVR